jgi:hypothetical protein
VRPPNFPIIFNGAVDAPRGRTPYDEIRFALTLSDDALRFCVRNETTEAGKETTEAGSAYISPKQANSRSLSLAEAGNIAKWVPRTPPTPWTLSRRPRASADHSSRSKRRRLSESHLLSSSRLLRADPSAKSSGHAKRGRFAMFFRATLSCLITHLVFRCRFLRCSGGRLRLRFTFLDGTSLRYERHRFWRLPQPAQFCMPGSRRP